MRNAILRNHLKHTEKPFQQHLIIGPNTIIKCIRSRSMLGLTFSPLELQVRRKDIERSEEETKKRERIRERQQDALANCYIPVWVRMCSFSVLKRVNIFSHSPHLYGLSSLWTGMWTLRSVDRAKRLPHSVHSNGFSPETTKQNKAFVFVSVSFNSHARWGKQHGDNAQQSRLSFTKSFQQTTKNLQQATKQ